MFMLMFEIKSDIKTVKSQKRIEKNTISITTIMKIDGINVETQNK